MKDEKRDSLTPVPSSPLDRNELWAMAIQIREASVTEFLTKPKSVTR